MLTKFKNILLAATGLTILLSPALVPVAAYAQDIPGSINCGTNFDLSSSSCPTDTGASASRLSGLITSIINIFSVVVGIVAVIMIIFGGLKYVISGGDSNNVSGAKNTIIFALVGLIIVALAQVIVHFVLAKLGTS